MLCLCIWKDAVQDSIQADRACDGLRETCQKPGQGLLRMWSSSCAFSESFKAIFSEAYDRLQGGAPRVPLEVGGASDSASCVRHTVRG